MNLSFPLVYLFFSGLVGILAIVFMLQLWRRPLVPRIIKPAYWISVALTVFYVSYITYLQYRAFGDNPVSLTIGKQGIWWFVGYAQSHFWNPYIISFIASLLIFWVSAYLNRKRGEIFFETEETYLIALGTFATGYPGFFFYIIFVLFVSVIGSVALGKKNERFPLYYVWMPSAIALLCFILFFATHQDWWARLLF